MVTWQQEFSISAAKTMSGAKSMRIPYWSRCQQERAIENIRQNWRENSVNQSKVHLDCGPSL